MGPTDILFGGRYRMVGEVGRGGMGVIYRGVDTILDREVAIKVMSADFAESGDDAKARFLREAKAAAKLQHRNIVTVFEFSEQDGVSYIVMEFLKGQSLAGRLAADAPMPLEQKLDVMTELCNGLQYAHENGVIHRDVKPANVWILDDGAVKLVDFGIAKITSSMMTMRGDVMGSAAYMSPEQIEGHSVTGRSDVFSTAIVLYEMLTRKRPFEGDSPTSTMMQIVHVEPPPLDSLVPGLPKELVAAIAKGLAKNPDDRFQSAAEFGAELQLIRMGLPRSEETVFVAPPAAEGTTHLNALPLKAEPLPPKRPEPSGISRTTPSLWALIGAGAAVLVVVTGLWLWFGRDRNPAPDPPSAPGDGVGVKTRPPAPVLRDFRVESKPTGADVLVGGASVGVTPITVRLASSGSFSLHLSGFQPLDVALRSGDFDRGSGTYSLQRLPEPAAQMVKVILTGNYPFEVRENGRTFRESSDRHEFSAQAGRAFTLHADKYFLDEPITVKAQRNGVMQESAPALGDIFFSGNQTCEIEIDGRSVKRYVGSLLDQIAAGPHRFRFKCEGGTQPERRYTVRAGAQNTWEVK